MKKSIVILFALCINLSLAAEVSDSVLFAAYQREDMSVWKNYIDSTNHSPLTTNRLLYEYGLCGYMVDRDKAHALPYVKRLNEHVEALKPQLPPGHYQMYKSAVYVFELRLKESMRPVTAMSMAKDATKLAPKDPLVLTYYGTSLFYAPKPFGSKEEALKWFERADTFFQDPQWRFCWLREANTMYIHQCHDKLK